MAARTARRAGDHPSRGRERRSPGASDIKAGIEREPAGAAIGDLAPQDIGGIAGIGGERRPIGLDDARGLRIRQRGEDREPAGANAEGVPIAGLQSVGADGPSAFLAVQAHRKGAPLHGEEGAVAALARDAGKAIEGEGMDARSRRGQRAEHIRLGPDVIAAARLVLVHQAGAHQGEKHPPRGGLGQAGAGHEIGKPRAVRSGAADQHQQRDRALDALGAAGRLPAGLAPRARPGGWLLPA